MASFSLGPVSFEVTSGAVCFGEPNNVRHGAKQPIQSPAPHARQADQSTFSRTTPIEYNYAALNGRWITYYILRESPKDRLDAFLCCHESVDPLREVRCILSVCGGIGDDCDSYSDLSSEKRGVVEVNRYEWGYHDPRGDPSEEDFRWIEYGLGASAMIVDYSAQSLESYGVAEPSEVFPLRVAGGDHNVGVRLLLRDHAYQCGRFGLTDDQSAVRSFLFHSFETAFEEATLGGALIVSSQTANPELLFTFAPAEAPSQEAFYSRISRRGDRSKELVFGPEEHVLQLEDLQAIRAKPDANLAPRSRTRSIALINGCALCFLTKLAEDMADRSLSQVAEKYVQSPNQAMKFIGRCLSNTEKSIPVVPVEVVHRIVAFMKKKGVSLPDQSAPFVGNAVGWLVDEILQLGENSSCMAGYAIGQRGMRQAVLTDQELVEIFMRSAELWTL